MRVEQEVVEPLLAHIRASRALDVGTGSGRYLPLLEATGRRVVVGVDFSLAMLRRGASDRVADLRRRAAAAVSPRRLRSDQRVADGRRHRRPRRLGARDGARARGRRSPGLLGLSSRRGRSAAGRRTFRDADGALHDISFNPHTIDEHLAALDAAGLRVRTIREPRFNSARDEAEPGIKAFRRRWGNPQVVVVFHAVKEP